MDSMKLLVSGGCWRGAAELPVTALRSPHRTGLVGNSVFSDREPPHPCPGWATLVATVDPRTC